MSTVLVNMETMYHDSPKGVKGNPCSGLRYHPGMTEDDVRKALRELYEASAFKSQKELAAKLGTTQDWVSRHFADADPPEGPRRQAAITIDDARALADALDHDVVIALVRRTADKPLSARGQVLLKELAAVVSSMSEQDLVFLELFVRTRKNDGA
jgi:hypothetical protein